MKFANTSLLNASRLTLSPKVLAFSLVAALVVVLGQASALAQCTLNGVTSPSSCTLTGPLTINSYSDAPGYVTTSTGALTNNGTMSIGYVLELVGDTSLSGPGVLSLNNAEVGTNSVNYTLTNASTIDGWGVIGSNAIPYQDLSLNNSGTIDADSSGNTLSIQGTGSSIVNSGTFEATGGGILNLATGAAINNNGGVIAATGTNSVVNVSTAIQSGTLTTSGGGVMGTVGSATLDASTQGAITLSDGSTYKAGPAGSNVITAVIGTFNLGTVSGSTMAVGGALELIGDTTVNTPGTGSITMNNGQIGTNSVNYTLTNNGLIQGSGIIGSNNATYQDLSLNNVGTIDANSPGNTLSIQGTGGSIINAGTFEATNGGILNVNTNAAVQNFGTIASMGSGSTVNLSGDIVGGTLTTSGGGVMQTSGTVTLDALNLGAITLTDGSTYKAAASDTDVQGLLKLGTTTGSTLQVTTNGSGNGYFRLINNTTLSGPGTMVLNGGLIGTNSVNYTLTNNVLIQGYGEIGSNVGADYQNLSLANNSIINANSSGKTLMIDGTGSSIVNAGLFEATNGGTLNLSTTHAINNQNGTITAGNGSTVNITNTTIQGGALTSVGTGVMQDVGSVTLDAHNLGAITLTDGSTLLSGAGTDTDVVGQFNLGTSTGSTIQVTTNNTGNGYFRLVGDTTLSGPGTLVLNGGLVGTNSVPYTLTNNVLIQGYGEIGSNIGADYQDLQLANNATINANSPGNTLKIDGTGSSIVNAGLLEATNGGTLVLSTQNAINNATGNITSSGSGSTVNVSTTIQGGTLNTVGGGVMQSVGNARLDGSSNGAITISDGSTYAIGAASALTQILGTLNLGTVTGGTLGLSSDLQLVGNTTLSGPGTMILSGAAQIGTNSVPYTLTNNSNIQGNGLIGSNVGALYGNNQLTNNGVILSSGGTLTLGGTGTLTNTGTLHASAGTTLVSSMSGLSNTTYASNSLLTGTYISDAAATVQINALGTIGGEIVNNSATIILNGVGSNFFDGGGQDVLTNFINNTASGSFTITNGRNFTGTVSSNFTNAGAVTVGPGSTFAVGGVHSYIQSGGSTQLIGTLVPGTLLPGDIDINGGVLFGNGGTVNVSAGGALKVQTAGTIAPAATINGSNVPTSAGSLSVNGDYVQAAGGSFNLGLGGLAPGTQFGFLGVSGNAFINGTLNVNLLNAFFPAVGDTFTFLTTGGTVTGGFSTTNGLNIGNGEILNVIYGSNFIELATAYSSTTDLWLGGVDVWSNGAQWSIGVPQPAFDTIIYSGTADAVTLDVNSTVNSLTIGGPANGFSSGLGDVGVAHTLVVTNGLTIGQQGTLDFIGNGSSITAGSVSNMGHVHIGPGVTLNLTAQPNGVTSVSAGALWDIGGNFAVGGVANTGFANLSNNAGTVIFENGASQSISTFLTNNGTLDVSNGSALTTVGMDNSGMLTEGYSGPGNNLIIINGTFTNNNAGFVDLESASTLTFNGNVINNVFGPYGMYTGFEGIGGNTMNIGGTLTNNGMFGVESAGDVVKVTGGVTNNALALFALTGGSSATFSSTLMNNGTVDAENASSLTVNGATTNNGTISASAFSGTGGNTMTFTALLTNGNGAQISLNNHDTLKASAGIANSGTITVKNGSTVDPPFINNIGIVNIDSTSTFVVGTGTATGPGYVQLANGTLGEMISNSNFGQIFASSASLNGTLDIMLQGGFNPAVGSSYDIILMSPGGLSGAFSTILNQVFNGGTEIWNVTYDNVNGLVVLTAAQNGTPTTPEPGTFLLFGSSLMGVAYAARRRWMK
jgi:hypothetical protein